MKWYGWIIIIVVLCAGAFTGGYFYGKSGCPQEAAVIDETPTHTEHDTPPAADPCAWYGACQKSDIQITGKFRHDKKNIFDVEARDACKHADKSFTLAFPVRERTLSIQIMPFIFGGYNSELKRADVFAGGQLAVLRNYGLFSVGGAGIYAYNFMSKDHYGGGGAVFGFNP
ncbi:MAG: hypothetical protein WC374_06975 [Phycisphaerae bacterium]|jgi:hypothetical protein